MIDLDPQKIDRGARKLAIGARVRARRRIQVPSDDADQIDRRSRSGAYDAARSTSNGTAVDAVLEELAGALATAWPAGEAR